MFIVIVEIVLKEYPDGWTRISYFEKWIMEKMLA